MGYSHSGTPVPHCRNIQFAEEVGIEPRAFTLRIRFQDGMTTLVGIL